jgi:gliding motility-associated-like protein
MVNNFFRRYASCQASSESILFSSPGKAIVLFLFVVCVVSSASAQVCDCPPPSACGPCQGGLTKLTLRLNNFFSYTVTVFDGGGQIFSGVVAPGGTFSFSGSQANEKFQGPNLSVRINGSPNANIGTGCGSDVDVGDRFGTFTVVAGESKNGGALCCHPSDVDDDAPDIDDCPSNRMVNLPANACTAAVSWTPPTADDDCTLASFESNFKPGDQFPVGTTAVVYTAKDKMGNTSTCRFNVTVADVTRPDIVNCPPTVNVSATSSCQAVVTWTPPTATDNCSATMTSTHNPGASFPLGTTKVTYTAKDARGNTATCTFDIHVKDDGKPDFTGCPADISVVENDGCESTVTWKPPMVADACGGDVMVSSTHKPGEKFSVGSSSTVVYTATDSRGNKATCSFTVNVTSGEGPVVKGCPEPMTVKSDEDGEAVVTWEEPEGSASCGRVTMKRSHAPGSTFMPGTTPVQYTFTDNAGRVATCAFDVIVLKPEIVVDISKAVTPDGDGIHDRWELTHIEKYKDNSVLIIDRWGNKIFETRGYDNERVFWDGKVPTGTYFYTVEVRVKDTVWRQKGSLEVIQ